MNARIFLVIVGWAHHWPWLDRFMIFAADYLWYLMVFGVLVLAFMNWRRWRDLALVSIGSAGLARAVFVSILKWLYVHPRPSAAILRFTPLETPDGWNSFPSGHTTFVFALAMGVYLYDKRLGRWYFVLAALVGFARIFVGVHWPDDVIAGIVCGVLSALLGQKIYRRYFKRIVEKY